MNYDWINKEYEKSPPKERTFVMELELTEDEYRGLQQLSAQQGESVTGLMDRLIKAVLEGPRKPN